MKIVLIYAKSQAIRELAEELFADDTKTKGELARDEIYAPLGITTLAAYLERDGHDVLLLDDSIRTLDEVKDGMRWAEFVGISVLTPNARRGRKLGLISKNEIGRFTVMGGPHPTTNPEFFLEPGAADICAQGEGDLTLPEIIEHFQDRSKWEDIQGITFMKDGEVHANPRRPLIFDMDSVPVPAYHLWDMEEYMRLMVNPGVTAMTSRGCPFQCTFCDAEMTPRQYRSLSVEKTVDLVEFLLKTYNPPQIIFFDDLFTIQRKRVIAICKEIVKRDLSFEWLCESRIDTMDYEMLRWMRKAGCVKIAYGLESGSPKMLTTMKKGVTKDKIMSGAKLNRELGMYLKFFMLYGFPEETIEDHRLTEDLIADARPDSICVALLQPIPGTAFYEQVKPYLTNEVSEIEFHYWHSTECFKHPNFTHEELQQERERLIRVQYETGRSISAKIKRKLERISAMIRHPELIADWFEIRGRHKRHLKRVSESKWAYIYKPGGKDMVSQQVPKLGASA